MSKIKETDLAPPMIEWLQQQGYMVYQEVRLGGAGMPIIDLIGVRDDAIHAVELKTTFGLSVMAQANYNKDWFCYSSIAVPRGSKKYGADKRPRKFAEGICRDRGIGVFYIDLNCEMVGRHYVMEAVPPKVRDNKMRDYILELLHENHKVTSNNLSAGSKGGGYHTPYKEMIAIVKEIITNSPGIGINELMAAMRDQQRLNKISYVPLRPTLISNLKKIENWCLIKGRGVDKAFYVR